MAKVIQSLPNPLASHRVLTSKSEDPEAGHPGTGGGVGAGGGALGYVLLHQPEHLPGQPRDKRREESAWIRKEIVFAEDENCQVEPSEAAAVYAAAAVGRAARRAAGRASRGAAASEGAGPHADRARHSQVRKQHAFFCGRHFFAF